MSPRAAWRLESLGFTTVFDYAAGKLDWFASGLPAEGKRPDPSRIGHLAVKDVPTCGTADGLDTVRARIGEAGWGFCLVVNDERVVLGRVRAADLDGLPDTDGGTAGEVMREGPSTFRPNVPVQEMLPYMREHGLDSAIVTTSGGHLVGVLRLEDAERAAAELESGAYAPPDQAPYFAR